MPDRSSPVLVQHSSPPHSLLDTVAEPHYPQHTVNMDTLSTNTASRPDLAPRGPDTESSEIRDPPISNEPPAVASGTPLPRPAIPAPEQTDRTGRDSTSGEANDGVSAPEQRTEQTPAVVPLLPTSGTESAPATASPDPPPPPPPVPTDEGDKHETPEWVNFEEDTSAPDEDELKEIEGKDSDISARNCRHHERHFFREVDDVEQRPSKKIRLSWTIQGVRGTRDRPNYVRVMHSPAAYIDGFYWHIKFFPRGNNSTALSAYIKCSRKPPKQENDRPKGIFRVYQGPPDADLGLDPPSAEVTTSGDSPQVLQYGAESTVGTPVNTSQTEVNALDATIRTGVAMVDTSTSAQESVLAQEAKKDDWRIPAQLGMMIYNPVEPRTGFYMASEHQFNKHNDDWGWTNFSGNWNEIHIRHRGQRQALLRNDTLALDAYIQVFDDPTKALWWHPAPETENQWDSKSLAGYYPMGTPPLYHSPGVAGITSWLLLAPFRRIIESVDVTSWRQDSTIKPRPLICQLQLILFLMRHMKREEAYVNVNFALELLNTYGETFSDVVTFWEVFRRSIEVELEDDEKSLLQIRNILDAPADSKHASRSIRDSSGRIKMLEISVSGVKDVQTGAERIAKADGFPPSLPDFLPILLQRQQFSTETRQWTMKYDRVRLNEELKLAQLTGHSQDDFTLYGCMVHTGERCSGKFYSILRPNGPGSKWLAFEDGNGNKVFSYTKQRVEKFEGLEGEELKSFQGTMTTVYMAMYIRTCRLKEYLPGQLEPYDIPTWLKFNLSSRWHGDDKELRSSEAEHQEHKEVEIYSDASVEGRRGLLDMFNLKQVNNVDQNLLKLTVPSTTTFKDLRRTLCQRLSVDSPNKVRLWIMQYNGLGEYTTASLMRITLDEQIGRESSSTRPLCLWMSILQSDDNIVAYGYPDPVEAPPPPPPAAGNEADLPHQTLAADDRTHEGLPSALRSPSQAYQVVENDTTGESILPTTDQVAWSSSLAPMPQAAGEQAASDRVQESVAAAVEHTTEALPSTGAGDAGTIEQLDGRTRVHGHLVDIVTIGEQDLTAINASSDFPVQSRSGPQEGAAETNISERLESTHPQGQPETSSANNSQHPSWLGNIRRQILESSRTSADVPLSTAGGSSRGGNRKGPVRHIYGFIQLFDADEQNFKVKSPFFAEWKTDVKTTIRKRLGYATDREFQIWHRVRAYDAVLVRPNTTFKEINFRDGVDIIVGDVLPEEQSNALLSAGKFVTPSSLSYFLWMTVRGHPTLARTGEVVLDPFGGNYYTGPLLNGRYHGPNGILLTQQGHHYNGPFVAGEKSGSAGTMVYQNGDVYTGSWRKDEKDGQGTLTEKRTGNKYAGGFHNGKRWGEGVTYWKVADEQRDLCQICYGEEVDALFYDCGHVCACVDCAKQCESCPICRRSIQKVVKMFRV